MKVVIGISGASGAHLGVRLAAQISLSHQSHIVLSDGASEVLARENGKNFNEILEQTKHNPTNTTIYNDTDIGAAIASGSFGADAMIVAPCSINSLAKISNGIADTLLTRCAAVMLKERRKLALAVRETPLSPISLRQMSDLATLGVIVAPPILGYYSSPISLQDMENFIIGKWLDALGIENQMYKRWS